MKYIRTKDGIYEVAREILNGKAYEIKLPQSEWWYDEDNKCYYEDSKFSSFHKREIIKEADTIEKLCDAFVVVGADRDKDGHPLLWNIKQDIAFMMNEFFECNIIYGAIWTGKGLIYVAKLNEKGELELI